MKLNLRLLSFFVFTSLVAAQQKNLSSKAEISVLTIAPGKHLNDAFGHSAFRIKDKTQGLDVVYGYGRYDFNTPNFYLKFIKGKLNYLISRNKFRDVYKFYVAENRSITEQVLDLETEEKQLLYNFLVTNYKPKNRRYLYDFFYDNCATKIRDVAQKSTKNNIAFNTTDSTEVLKTFRKLIHEHLGKNTWGSFGIDLALGSTIDRKATLNEQMFLPKYIFSAFGNATLSGKPLVKETNNIFMPKNQPSYKSPLLYSPLIILGLIALIIFYITQKDIKKRLRSRWLDVIIFTTNSLTGIILTLLWFATDHTTTGYNYNLLWAFPFNIFIIFQISKVKPKQWTKGYIKFLLIMLTLMTLHWIMNVQVFSLVLIPLLVALVYRYLYLIKHIN